MTADEYREKWGLPNDYPMTAPAYAAKRSELALSIGLGQILKKRPPLEPTAIDTNEPAEEKSAKPTRKPRKTNP